jgi:Cu/Ag efflux pump CusA
MAPVNRIETDLVLPLDGPGWDETIRDVESRLVRVPGIGVAVEGFLSERIHEILSGETAPVVIKAIGPDLTQLRPVAAQAARIAADTPGLEAIQAEPQIDCPSTPHPTGPDRGSVAQDDDHVIVVHLGSISAAGAHFCPF